MKGVHYILVPDAAKLSSTSMLELISRALGAEGRDHLDLAGDKQDRARVVERFQTGECP